jgi:lipopolysaccharide/colanic/teichoic acid biosynthesis glycosyltransferase
MPRRRLWYALLKRTVDFVAALMLLLGTLPIVLLAMLVVKLTSPGPALYSQTRLGRHGRTFTIYKIRTMKHNCEQESGIRWCVPGDSRVTLVGKLLRRTHIDELPQLWNVLRGDMSLIGPRPERPEFLPELESAIPFYRDRLLVRPGLSGLAQVQLPPDTDLHSVRRKLAHDLYYIRHASLGLDWRLMLGTLGYLLKFSPDFTCRTLRIPGGAGVEDFYRQLVGRQPKPPAKTETLAAQAAPQPSAESRRPAVAALAPVCNP